MQQALDPNYSITASEEILKKLAQLSKPLQQTILTQLKEQLPIHKTTKPRPALFRALGDNEPPPKLVCQGNVYQRKEILKHDSWAATAIYMNSEQQLVCKFNRQQAIGFIPMRWLGRRLAARERWFFQRLSACASVPDDAGDIYVNDQYQEHVAAHPFIPGVPLKGHEEGISAEFFIQLHALVEQFHSLNLAYVDLNKRENIIVGPQQKPYLIDFQISYRPGGLARLWPLKLILSLLQKIDIYHINKHHTRIRPQDFSASQLARAQQKPLFIRCYRLLQVPLRNLRRGLLTRLGIRKSGKADSEVFLEDAVRQQLPKQHLNSEAFQLSYQVHGDSIIICAFNLVDNPIIHDTELG